MGIIGNVLSSLGSNGWMLVVFSYMAGTIPSGLIIAKIWRIQDPRNIGSGNIGATNMLRTGNKKVALATLLADMLKGALPTLAGVYMFRLGYGGSVLPYVAMLSAVVGHCFPVWLKFRGGKGVATYMGCIAALPASGFLLVGTLIWLAVAFYSRYSSLAALCSVLGVSAYAYYVADLTEGIIFSLLTLLVFFQHRVNIIRLWKRTESRIEI